MFTFLDRNDPTNGIFSQEKLFSLEKVCVWMNSRLCHQWASLKLCLKASVWFQKNHTILARIFEFLLSWAWQPIVTVCFLLEQDLYIQALLMSGWTVHICKGLYSAYFVYIYMHFRTRKLFKISLLSTTTTYTNTLFPNLGPYSPTHSRIILAIYRTITLHINLDSMI